MKDRNSHGALPTKLGGALVLGILLGLGDAALHGDVAAWSHDPGAVARALVYLMLAYSVPTTVAALVAPWRLLVLSSVGVFSLLQTVASFARANPSGGVAGTVLALAAGVVLAGAAAWTTWRLLGRDEPRRRLIGSALVLPALLAVASWVVDRDTTTASHAAATRAATATGQARTGSSPNVLLITLDTLRADRVGAYGYEAVHTPTIDRLSTEGALFRHALVQASTTPPSHASILTGVNPARHGVRAFEGAYTLATDTGTLAEVLSDHGWDTGAVVASIPLAPGYGIERGFAGYDFAPSERQYAFYGFRDALAARTLKRLQLVRDHSGYRNAAVQTDLAIEWLEQRGDRPFFLWVHYFDVHDPYVAPVRHLSTNAHPGSSAADVLKRSYLYDSEVSYLDEEIGRLTGYLEGRGMLDDTIVTAISDHGEALGEHNYVGHSTELYQEQLHAVFFLRYPGPVPAGSDVRSQVRSIDLFPTVLELAGVSQPNPVEGRSLLGLILGSETADRTAFAETLEGRGQRLVSVSDGRFKLISNPESGREELYDLETDPRELHDLVADRPDVLARLRGEIGSYIESTVVRDDEKVTLQQNTRQRLRALGYLD